MPRWVIDYANLKVPLRFIFFVALVFLLLLAFVLILLHALYKPENPFSCCFVDFLPFIFLVLVWVESAKWVQVLYYFLFYRGPRCSILGC
jgi:hypothetical protein